MQQAQARGGCKASARDALALMGGSLHYSAYHFTLLAFGSTDSTVITPLMQLSALWMLPFSTITAVMGLAPYIRPLHLLSVAFICAGGFLPAALGSLSELLRGSFWRQRAVRYVMTGELLVALYTIIAHQCTSAFAGDGGHGGGAAATADAGADTLRFFGVSRLANGLTCALLFCSSPSLRAQARALLHGVSVRFALMALLGECLSLLGVFLATFSVAAFYEPSVVNAAEGGLQQLFNLIFALVSHKALGAERVDHVRVKIVSFLLVTAGLALSTF